jgi:pilus assembly protein CpaB
MTRRLLAAVAALLVALAGAAAVVAYARGADRRALAGQEGVRVYVAAKEVPAGTTAASAVRQGMLAPRLVARAVAPDDVLTAVDDANGQLIATSTIAAGELVLRTRFAARGTTRGGLIVPEGLLAVSVALDDPSRVGSFVTVGARVAVFDTFNERTPNAAEPVPAGDHLQDDHDAVRATRLLLPSVEVLAVGATTTATVPVAAADESGAGGAADGSGAGGAQAKAGQGADPAQTGVVIVNLAVTQAQAERLVHGSRTGTLTFALLGPGTDATPGLGVDDSTMFAANQSRGAQKDTEVRQ